MNSKLKKLLSSIAISTCLLSTGVVAFAETVSFSITAGRYDTNIVSSRSAQKAGGSNYENKFYVTPTSSTGGFMNVWSRQNYNSNVQSSDAGLDSRRLNVRQEGTYLRYASSGVNYSLHGKNGTTTGGRPVNFQGRYTP